MNVIQALMGLARRERLSLSLEPRGEHIAVILRRNGSLVSMDTRESEILTPLAMPRTSGLRPNILFDSSKYLIEGKARAVSLALHRRLLEKAPRHPGLKAIVAFLGGDPPKLKDSKKLTQMMVYYLEGEDRPICEDPSLASIIEEEIEASFETVTGLDPLHGEGECVVAAHPKVNLLGLNNGQALITMDEKVAPIVPYPPEHRMLQAPMSFRAMMEYSVALRWLSKRTLAIWSVSPLAVTTFCWTLSAHPIESKLSSIFQGHPKGMIMKDWKESIDEWLMDPGLDSDTTQVFLLTVGCGSRIAIRQFESIRLSDLIRNLRRFVQAFRGHSPREILNHPSLTYLLNTTMVERWMEAILFGLPWPKTPLDWTVLARLKSKNTSKHEYTTRMAEMIVHATIGDQMQQYENDVMFKVGYLFGVCVSLNFYAKDRSDSVTLIHAGDFLSRYPAVGYAKRIRPKVTAYQAKQKKVGGRTYHDKIRDLELEIAAMGGFPMTTTPVQQCAFYAGKAAWDLKWMQDEKKRREEETKAEVEATDEIDTSNHPAFT